MISIDGSFHEGGGQIVRTALALSTITQQPFEVNNIRQGRKQPGLKAQHLHCIKALQKLCDAKVECAELGSTYLKYSPGKLNGKNIKVDIGTAGSVSLLLQAVLLPCLFSDKDVKINVKGGTAAKFAMPVEYLANVLVPHLHKFVDKLQVVLLKRGYFPKGGGEIEIKVKPKVRLKDFDSFDDFLSGLDNIPRIELVSQGKIIQVKGVSHSSKMLEGAKVAERQASAAKMQMNKLDCNLNINREYSDTSCPGSGVTLWAIFSKLEDEIDLNNPILLGADALGEKGKRAEIVGKEAADMLFTEINSGAPVDKHLADNLIPFMGLLKGSSIKVSSVTKHTETNIWVVEQFLGKGFEVDKNIIRRD